MNVWPTLELAGLLLLLWTECRLLALRTTVSPRRFLQLFAWGCIGATAVSLLVARLLSIRMGTASYSYSAGPVVEELAKAAPVLLIAFVWRDGRRLTITDLALIGLASGLGFEFAESNLRALTRGTIAHDVADVTPFIAGLRIGIGGLVVAAGHGVWTGVVGLAAGLGRRLRPKSGFAWLPAVLAIGWVSLDHAVFNWQLRDAAIATAAGANPYHPASLARVPRILYYLTDHGRLELIVLPIALLLFAIVEEMRARRRLEQHPEMLLDIERGSTDTFVHWGVALLRVRLGWPALRDTLAFFRERRAFAMIADQAAAHPEDAALAAEAVTLEQRLTEARPALDEAEIETGSWIPAVDRDALADWAWRHAGGIALAVVAILFFALRPTALPGRLSTSLSSSPVALGLIIVAAVAVVWALRGLLGERRVDDTAGAADQAPLRRHLAMLLAAAAVSSLVIAAFGWLVPRSLYVSPSGAGHLARALDGWVGAGGNAAGLLALGAALAAAAAAAAAKGASGGAASGEPGGGGPPDATPPPSGGENFDDGLPLPVLPPHTSPTG